MCGQSQARDVSGNQPSPSRWLIPTDNSEPEASCGCLRYHLQPGTLSRYRNALNAWLFSSSAGGDAGLLLVLTRVEPDLERKG